MSIHAGGLPRKLTLRREPHTTKRRMLAMAPLAQALPDETFNRVWCGPVLDQRALGACTEFAWISMYQMLLIKELMTAGHTKEQAVALSVLLSALFLYYYARVREGQPRDQDTGAMSGTPGDVLEDIGCCEESEWSYSDDGVKFAQTPPPEAMAAAAKHKGLLKFYLADELAMKRSLADGFSFAAGIDVFQDMEQQPAATSGMIPLPSAGDSSLGGHEIHFVDYCLDGWIIKQSWGEGAFAQCPYGAGYMVLPFGYPIYDPYTLRRSTDDPTA